jgi:hypothetical protein
VVEPKPSKAHTDLHKKILQRYAALKQGRSTALSKAKEIQEFILPNRGRGLDGEVSQTEDQDGEKPRTSIYDSFGTRAIRVAGNGLYAGLTPGTRPWFEFATGIPEIDSKPANRAWLYNAAEKLRSIFVRAGFYQAIHHTFHEVAGFGTAALAQLDSVRNVAKFRPFTFGEYCIALNYDGEVDTFYREMWYTAAQIVGEFGKENCSNAVQKAAEDDKDTTFLVIHAIEPDDRTLFIPGPKRPFRSVYLEKGGDSGVFLRLGGYRSFRFHAPRWDVVGNEVYGNGIGHEILPDVKQLQKEQEKKLIALDKMVDPPTVSQGDVTDLTINSHPGGHTFDTSAGVGRDGLRPLYQVRPELQALTADIAALHVQISEGAFNNLFLSLTGRAGQQPLTAREVAELHEEKLSQIGPALERLFDTVLKPVVNTGFEQMVDAGILDPAPQDLQDAELKIEFTGPLAMALRMSGIGSLESYAAFVGSLSGFRPDVIDKVDADKMVDIYAEKSGVPPEVTVPDEAVAAIRDRRAQQQQAAAAMQAGQQAAEAAKTLSETSLAGQNALKPVIEGLNGGRK